MFDRGISDEFANALKNWKHWEDVINDGDLFLAMRKECINIYFQGCSIFEISFREEQLKFKTHYKYLVHPNLKSPLISWNGESLDVEDRVNEIFISKFDLDSLKKSSSNYAGAEKEGVHCILKSNRNVIDVEVALSPNSEVETDSEDQNTRRRGVGDRIDFAAIQRKDGMACIVFFEAKRFDNSELRSRKPEPPVFEQVQRYETFIKNYGRDLETSYRRVCKNLVKLAPNRYDPLVKQVADSPEQLTVDPRVRLVVFGYDEDQDGGKVWNKYKKILLGHFENRLLLRGKPSGFIRGISK